MSCGDPHEVDCGKVLAEVYLYLDSECGDDDRSQIRHHLDECAPCLREYGVEQAVRALVARSCGGDLAPEHLRSKLTHTLRRVVVEVQLREHHAE